MGTTRKPVTKTDQPATKKAKRPAYLQKGDPTLERLLKELYVDPEAWLNSPNTHFGERRPRDLVGTDEECKVYSLLRAVDLGMF